MDNKSAPIVFLSYSHLDKHVARRLVRRFTAHGIVVWIDERELRVGATLTSSIRTKIKDADTLLVIASQSSARSNWVGLEVEFACEYGKTIIPLYIESVAENQRFSNYLGVDATSPQMFADVVQGLMSDLLFSFDLELPLPDPAVLTAGLRDLAREEPDLAPLILGCLDSEGLQQENVDTVANVAFHALDETLNTLFDLRPVGTIAHHAASGFSRSGAGVRALSLWIDATGDGQLPLVDAVGSRTLAPMLIPTAINLLTACSPPNNHALYQFIHHSSAQLESTQRRSVIRLVTWPVRADAGSLGDVLAWVALKHFPDSAELQQMWTRWVHAGAFDGKPNSPMDLTEYLTDATNEKLSGWDAVNEAVRSHVRGYLRSADKHKVVVAMDYVQAAADAGTPVLALLLRETEGVSATAEWNDWSEREPNIAEWMKWYVLEVSNEAKGERNWLRAWERAKEIVAFMERRQRILKKDDGESDGNG